MTSFNIYPNGYVDILMDSDTICSLTDAEAIELVGDWAIQRGIGFIFSLIAAWLIENLGARGARSA